MQKGNLIATLKGLGFDSNETKDILLYTLNTKDRQEQMLTWLLTNKGDCDKQSVRIKAQEILQGFLASNPYNNVAKSMPVPKWEPPPRPPVRKPAAESPQAVPKSKDEPRPAEEDPIDKLITIFTKHRT